MAAGVVYCIRVLAVEFLLPAEERGAHEDAELDEFLTTRQKYLTDGSGTVMSGALTLLTYGKSLAMGTGNAGSTYWSHDKSIFYLHGVPIYLTHFCHMAQQLVARAEDMLWQELMWVPRTEDRFTIPLADIVDDVSLARQGESFVTRPQNKLSHGLQSMLTWAQQRERGRRLQSDDGVWSHARVKRYLRQVDRFLELLLLGVHITSGQPGRGPEITSIRHRNSFLQDRNIYVVDGQVMTVVRYCKSQAQWDKPKVVPRYLPARLGQVMAVYLVYLQPFCEYLRVHVLGGPTTDYVWADNQGPWNTDRLTRLLKRETGKALGMQLNTQRYRHTAVGIGRVVVGDNFSKGYQDDVGEGDDVQVDDDETLESALELQNARTTRVGVGHYGVRLDIVQHLSVRSMNTFRPLSMAWHRFLGLAGEPASQTANNKRSRPLSWQDDALLRPVPPLPPHGQAASMPPQPTPPPSSDTTLTRLRPTKEQVHSAMQQVLSKADVTFRSKEQERALHAVLEGQTPLVVVLPTGGGKTLLFTVPACLDPEGVTVVVVPFRALLLNLMERVLATGVTCAEWKGMETPPTPLLFVSADVAGDITSQGNFLAYAGILQTQGLLRRVVVDECHLIITASDWRPKLAQLKNLRFLSCPLVLLTGTLPPVREQEIAESMHIRAATYIRAITARLNTRYFVSWCSPGKAFTTAITICRRRQGDLLRQSQKGIIYLRSKQLCETLAGVLGVIIITLMSKTALSE
ncbi:RecQ family helicase [Pyrenophora teres f. maculata]|nr:RecQ family helicase [Pyrenophora teres f. maculata]